MKIPLTSIHYKPKYFISYVKENYGDAVPVWLNTNSIFNRCDGGVTGYFRNIRQMKGPFFKETGIKFHGILINEHIETTEGRY